MTMFVPFLVGRVIGPMTEERENCSIVDGDYGEMGEDEDGEGGVDSVSEAFRFGKGTQVEHQNCHFDETDCDEV